MNQWLITLTSGNKVGCHSVVMIYENVCDCNEEEYLSVCVISCWTSCEKSHMLACSQLLFLKHPTPFPQKASLLIYIYTHLKTNKQMKKHHLCCICCILILPLYFLFLQRSGCHAQWWHCCFSSAVSSSPSWALGCTAVPSTHTSVAPWVTWLTTLTSTCATSTTSTPPPNTSSLHDRQ